MMSPDRPVYLQLRDRIAASILDGTYGDGDQLPSVRAYAAAQGANPLTVAKAYQMFQEEGLITVKRGVGMFVADGATEKLMISERQVFIDERWPRIRRAIDRLGLDARDLLDRADA